MVKRIENAEKSTPVPVLERVKLFEVGAGRSATPTTKCSASKAPSGIVGPPSASPVVRQSSQPTASALGGASGSAVIDGKSMFTPISSAPGPAPNVRKELFRAPQEPSQQKGLGGGGAPGMPSAHQQLFSSAAAPAAGVAGAAPAPAPGAAA